MVLDIQKLFYFPV